MPRILLACPVLLAGCFFQADYTGGQYRCSDGKCPSGLSCIADRCVVPSDARIDAPIDARQAALTCADPGLFPPAGGSASGMTIQGASKVSANCNGFVMNGPDAIYRIDANIGDQLKVSVTGVYADAYVIAPCTMTASCIGQMFATATAPITITVGATTQYFIVVDNPNPTDYGSYTLTVGH